MNETEQIFTSFIAFGVGYAIAFFFKNMGRLWREWGAFIGIFTFPSIIIGLIMAAAMLADMRSAIISTIFAAGFIVRMGKRDG